MTGFRPRFFLVQDRDRSVEGPSATTGTTVALSERDSHHVRHVLRLRKGDLCEVVVGESVFAASVSSTDKPVKVTLVERLAVEAAGAAYRLQVGIVQALTRPGLLSQILEKGTEVGASFFIMVSASGSTRLPESSQASRLDRWRRIVMEAAKQSKHLNVPEVSLGSSLEDVRDELKRRRVVSVVLEPSAEISLGDVLKRQMEGQLASACVAAGDDCQQPTIALWIGPEGGWSQTESIAFAEAGMDVARLGQSVLRAETAGAVAVAATRLIIDDW